MKVRFDESRAIGTYNDLTHGKVYEVESIINEWPDDYDDNRAYLLYEDDEEQQVAYSVAIFEVVE